MACLSLPDREPQEGPCDPSTVPSPLRALLGKLMNERIKGMASARTMLGVIYTTLHIANTTTVRGNKNKSSHLQGATLCQALF